MQLDRVTITGADDSIDPVQLLELTEEFPFVEWGILVSKSSEGKPRFPTRHWVNGLSLLTRKPHCLPLSLHVCGSWTRDILLGVDNLPAGLLFGYARVQLNFHAERCKCDPVVFAGVLRNWRTTKYVKQVIFQIDGANGNEHLDAVSGQFDPEFDYVSCVPLFDVSGGAGIVPASWPRPCYFDHMEEPLYHGYAGGLGPDNLDEQLLLIAAAAQPAWFWIDMETRVRSEHDKQFDLAKVRRCLEICKPHITARTDDIGNVGR